MCDFWVCIYTRRFSRTCTTAQRSVNADVNAKTAVHARAKIAIVKRVQEKTEDSVALEKVQRVHPV